MLARQGAALDVLSQGRFVLGVGAGWFAGEAEAVGVPAAERDARLEENIAVCKELWAPGPSSFDGKWNSFADMICEPAPFTPGGPPVWWGMKGTTPAAARRVTTMGDGWIASESMSVIDIARSVDNIHTACADLGRDPATVGIRASLALLPADADHGFDAVVAHALESVRRLCAVGVTHMTIPLDSYELDLDGLGRLLSALRNHFA